MFPTHWLSGGTYYCVNCNVMLWKKMRNEKYFYIEIWITAGDQDTSSKMLKSPNIDFDRLYRYII